MPASVGDKPYGSARDLPSYVKFTNTIRGFKLVFWARSKTGRKIRELERQMESLATLVDQFYSVLGPRHWIFNEAMNVDRIAELLNQSVEAASTESGLIDLMEESLEQSINRLWGLPELLSRRAQIERAVAHYQSEEFDSCVLHLVSVVDGFVNDRDTSIRKGLAARDVESMIAWDSVTGHHQGLTCVLQECFQKSIRKRIDDEVYEVYRHGIVHGMVTNFDNRVVAMKAFNLLFATADWARAIEKRDNQPVNKSWRETFAMLIKLGERRKVERSFVPVTIRKSDDEFDKLEVVVAATKFLENWEHGRWGLLVDHMPPQLRRDQSNGALVIQSKDGFGAYRLREPRVEQVELNMPGTANVEAIANVDNCTVRLKFRMIRHNSSGECSFGYAEVGSWVVVPWAPSIILGNSEPAD